MQKKLVRKIAYQLWQYEVDKHTSKNFECWSKLLKMKLESYLKKELTTEIYISILEMYSKIGYIPNFFKLEKVLYRQLLKIMVMSVKEDKLHCELDD